MAKKEGVLDEKSMEKLREEKIHGKIAGATTGLPTATLNAQRSAIGEHAAEASSKQRQLHAPSYIGRGGGAQSAVQNQNKFRIMNYRFNR